MPDDQFESYLRSAQLQPWTPKTITDPKHLRAEIERVRQAGVGFDDAEFNDEVRCVAAPIRDFTGKAVGAVGVSGPIWRMNLQRMELITQRVRETAAELSEELGYRPAE
jgi:DNA-binding IclR family transcriptional regulator